MNDKDLREMLEIAVGVETVLTDGWTLTKKLIAECETLRIQNNKLDIKLDRVMKWAWITCPCCGQDIEAREAYINDTGAFCSGECSDVQADETANDNYMEEGK